MSIFDLFKKDQRTEVYCRNHNSILNGVIPHFKQISIEKARAIVLWADSQGPSRERGLKAKALGKPLIVVQHGRHSVVEYLPPISFELLADKICVWGPSDRNMLLKNGIDSSRVVLTGAPIFDGIERARERTDRRNVVFAPLHWDREIEENHQVYDALSRIKDINLTVKLLEKRHDPKRYGKNVIINSQKDPNLLQSVFKLLKKTDIVVSNTAGTFELIAMYLNIPVIYIDNFKPRSFVDLSAETVAEQKSKEPPPRGVDYTKDLADLEGLIKLNIADPDRLKVEREKELYDCAAVGLLKYPVQNIINVIMSCINNESNVEIK